jgi:hypothetical protein
MRNPKKFERTGRTRGSRARISVFRIPGNPKRRDWENLASGNPKTRKPKVTEEKNGSRIYKVFMVISGVRNIGSSEDKRTKPFGVGNSENTKEGESWGIGISSFWKSVFWESRR